MAVRCIPATSERRYFLSVDIGKMGDFTAIALIARIREGTGVWDFNKRNHYAFGGWNEPHSLSLEKETVRYEVPRLKRLPLGLLYPVYADEIAEMFARVKHEDPRAELIADATGVGRGPVDMIAAKGLKPVAITLHGGRDMTRTGQEIHLPKNTAIQRYEAAAHMGELKIASNQPEAEILRAEMQDFRAKYTPSGSLTFSHRAGANDDLLLAAACGVWYAAQPPREIHAVKVMGL